MTIVEQELAQIVTVHCTSPPEVMTQLGIVLEGLELRKVSSREPTLEDAYVQLIGEST